jgi:FixJ family two-component response regulator
MLTTRPILLLVADAPKALRGLGKRIRGMGLHGQECESPEECLATEPGDRPACVLLHLSETMPGLEILRRLRCERPRVPVVVIAALADVPLAVRAMKLGASDFLEECCTDEVIAQAVAEALRWSDENRRKHGRIEIVRRRMDRLADSHRQVLQLLIAGKSNREIADELKLSVRTIEVRRAKIMQTMRAKSLAELVRLAVLGGGPS